MTKQGKQYLNKREYIGHHEIHYALKYGNKAVLVMMNWVGREYEVIWARQINIEHLGNYEEFPYHRTPKVIDRIEELLK